MGQLFAAFWREQTKMAALSDAEAMAARFEEDEFGYSDLGSTGSGGHRGGGDLQYVAAWPPNTSPTGIGDTDYDNTASLRGATTAPSKRRWKPARVAEVALIGGLVVTVTALSVVIADYNNTEGAAPTACQAPVAFEHTDQEWAVLRPQQLYTCFSTVPLDDDMRNATVDILRAVAGVYQFTDLAANSGPPYHVAVDLPAELDRIADTPYACAYDFHRDAQRIFERLYDAHTAYVPPLPYERVAFTVRPFELETLVDPANTSRQIVRAAAEAEFANVRYSTLRQLGELGDPLDLEDYLGDEIVAINGRPALEYLAAQADAYGLYKDTGAQFIAYLKGFPAFHLAPYRYDLDYQTLVLKFAVRGTLVLDPVVVFPAACLARMGGQPVEACQASGDGSHKTPLERVLRAPRRPHEQPHTRVLQLVQSAPPPTRVRHRDGRLAPPTPTMLAAPAPPSPVRARYRRNPSKMYYAPFSANANWAGHVECGRLYEDPTSSAPPVALLRLPTLDVPPGGDSESEALQRYWDTVIACREEAIAAGVTALLMDVSSNPGGRVVLAQLVAWTLSSRYVDDLDATLLTFDARLPRLDAVGVPEAHAADYLPHLSNHSVPCQPDTYFAPATEVDRYRQLDRGGSDAGGPSNFTAIFADTGLANANEQALLLEEARGIVADLDVQGRFDKILVLSDGLCGSACAILATTMHRDNATAVATYGGLLGQALDMGAYGGGEVIEWDDYVERLPAEARARLRATDLPPSAFAKFTATEYYARHETLPSEWVRHPADRHINLWPRTTAWDDMIPVYERALALFPSLPSIPRGPFHTCSIPSP